jgi:hypothetical protein
VESQPEVRLISSVITLAIRDLTHRPIVIQRGARMTPEARSAARFLFTDDSDGYLEAIDCDPPAFRQRILAMMNNMSGGKVIGFDENDRRAMRQNYKLWSTKYAGLDYDLPDDEDESDEDAFIAPKKRGRFSHRIGTTNSR